jgi:hypothetical protein
MVALIVAVGIGTGCSGHSRAPSPTTTSVTSTTLPALTASPTTVLPVAAGPQPCDTLNLHVTPGTTGVAAGSVVLRLAVSTASTEPCLLSGYFGLALLDGRGAPIGPDPSRDPGLGSGAGPATVTLDAAHPAWFALEWSDSTGSSVCVTAARIELTAPNQTDHVSVPARTAGGGAIAPCGNLRTFIGPVIAGVPPS